MKEIVKKIGIILIIVIVILGVMMGISTLMQGYPEALQYLVIFCVIDFALILMILILGLSRNVRENYRNLLNSRKIVIPCIIFLVVMVIIVIWVLLPKYNKLLIDLAKYIVSISTATLVLIGREIYKGVRNFLHPGTIQIKIWSTPYYIKENNVYIPSNFSVNVHNYNKALQKVSFLGICLTKYESQIFVDQSWENNMYLPDTLSTRINKVPSCDDLETVASGSNSESYRINREEMINYFVGEKKKTKNKYLKLEKYDNDKSDIKVVDHINEQLAKIYTTSIKGIESRLDSKSQNKCKSMFNKEDEEKKHLDLCIVYYVVDNPIATNNLITRHFRVEIND